MATAHASSAAATSARAKRLHGVLVDALKGEWLPVEPLIELVQSYVTTGAPLNLRSVECIKDGESVNRGFGIGIIHAAALHCVMWCRPPLTAFRNPKDPLVPAGQIATVLIPQGPQMGDEREPTLRAIDECDTKPERVLVYVENGQGTNRIRCANLSRTDRIDTLCGSANAYDDGPAYYAGFGSPWGIAVHPIDHALYVSEYMHRVRRIDPVSGEVKTIAGIIGSGCENGPGANARIGEARGITIASSGAFLLLADYGSSQVRRVDLVDPAFTVSALSSEGFLVDTKNRAMPAFAKINSVVMEMGDDSYAYVVLESNILRANLKTGDVRPLLEPITGREPGLYNAWNTAIFLAPNRMVACDRRGVAAIAIDTTDPRAPKAVVTRVLSCSANGLAYDETEDVLYATGGRDAALHVISGDVRGTIVDQ